MAALLALLLAGATPATPWKTLAPGVELGSFDAPPNAMGDHLLHVLRVDPAHVAIELQSASADGKAPRTARAWCEQTGAIAAINASMFKPGGQSVGLLRTRAQVNNAAVVPKYKAVLAADPRKPGLPAAKILDADVDDLHAAQADWGSLVQNLRMVDAHRANRWGTDAKHKWSTAAVGIDSAGRLLFIHSRSPYPVQVLTEALLAAPIDLQRAMYVEGGPEAQLYVHVGAEEHEWVGSYETGFFESDTNTDAWPIPNVIVVRAK